MGQLAAIRGEVLHFVADPTEVVASGASVDHSYEYWPDGVIIVEDGRVAAVGTAEPLLMKWPDSLPVDHYPGHLITPGFVDTHTHYPQTEIVGAYGEQLLQWLENYAFPAEMKYADYDYASRQAQVFIDHLLAQGTTTALVFATVHPQSVDAFFERAKQFNLRMICGKVLMDRNAPETLRDTVESGYHDSKILIEKWHGRGRLQYAVTPRFAPTSTEAQLAVAGRLLREYPDVYLHTHISENKAEIQWVRSLFPDANGYLDVYDRAGLLGRRSVFAHGVHLEDHEFKRLSEAQSAIAFCPSSNLFLGSGLFSLTRAERFKTQVGLGTDIGGGTSFSMLSTMGEAYKTQQLSGQSLSPFKSFYLATLGGAKALDLQDKIGSFTVGHEADFTVLDYRATPLLKQRISPDEPLADKLFAMTIVGDARCVVATYIMGDRVLRRDGVPGAR